MLSGEIMLKQESALKFIQELRGGWDCIIWDPPYMNAQSELMKNYRKFVRAEEINGQIKMGEIADQKCGDMLTGKKTRDDYEKSLKED